MQKKILIAAVVMLLLSCSKSKTDEAASVNISIGTWRISYFWNQTDQTSNYSSYYFMFLNGGTFMAHGSSTTITGTWSQTATRININFSNPAMSELNGNWLKTELTTSSIKLKDDSPSQDDQLYFVKN